MSLLKSGFSVANASFWRFFSAFIVIFLFFIIKPRRLGSWTNLLKMFGIGAIFYSIPSNLFLISSNYIGTGQAMVIFFTFPVFVMLLNWFFLGQAMRPHYFLALIMILIGLGLLVDLDEINTDFIGIGLSVVSSLSYAFYIFFSEKVDLPAFSSTMMVLAGCAFTSFLFALCDSSFALPTQYAQLLNIMLFGIFCSVLPILLMLQAMKYISSEKASLLSVLEPLFTVLFGVILLGEQLSLSMIAGISFTLMGAMAVIINPLWFLQPSKS